MNTEPSTEQRKLKTVKNPKPAPVIVDEGEGEDFDFGEVTNRPPLVPEGVYEVALVRTNPKQNCFGHERVILDFKIMTQGEHHGVELPMALNVSPRKGRKGLAFSSKAVRMSEVALGRPLTRTDRLTTKCFRGKAFRAQVVTVKRGFKRGGGVCDLAPVNHYSKIEVLLEKVTG